MSETYMNVKLIAHTQLSEEFYESFQTFPHEIECKKGFESQVVALTAIRTCYSSNKPSEIIDLEGEKYFEQPATDGEEGTEADRLIRMIFNSKHTSTLEHLNYTFAIEGISRALLAQLTRHRHFSFSVQSQRYVGFGSDDKSEGFDCILPDSCRKGMARDKFVRTMQDLQKAYDSLRESGVPKEDARAILPNAADTNLVMTGNLRSLLDFYSKRKPGRGAQSEISELAERLKDEIINVDGWTEPFFAKV